MSKIRKNETPAKILIDVPIHHASGRDVLTGVFHRMEMLSNWNIKLYQHEENPLLPEMVRCADEHGINGIIVSKIDNDELLQELSETNLPVISIGFGPDRFIRPPKRYTAVQNDGEGIGTMGAKYLLSLGRFRSFGFIWLDWAKSREQAFHRTIEADGMPCESLFIASQREDQVGKIEDWLIRLPKPAAVMLACDRIGLQVISACEKAGFRIPDQISLLGVDNDELICPYTTPTLSSVLPGHEEMGRRAVDEMNRLLASNGRIQGRTVVVHPLKVVERDSTAFLPPATKLLDRAKAFIAANACKGATVRDVVTHLKVSPRLAELRYRDIEGTTIREALEAVRLAKVKNLLATTKRPIKDIAAACGFRAQSHLAHLFAKRFGESMREFRRACNASPSS